MKEGKVQFVFLFCYQVLYRSVTIPNSSNYVGLFPVSAQSEGKSSCVHFNVQTFEGRRKNTPNKKCDFFILEIRPERKRRKLKWNGIRIAFHYKLLLASVVVGRQQFKLLQISFSFDDCFLLPFLHFVFSSLRSDIFEHWTLNSCFFTVSRKQFICSIIFNRGNLIFSISLNYDIFFSFDCHSNVFEQAVRTNDSKITKNIGELPW